VRGKGRSSSRTETQEGVTPIGKRYPKKSETTMTVKQIGGEIFNCEKKKEERDRNHTSWEIQERGREPAPTDVS